MPQLGKRELIFLLLFICYFVASVRRSFLFLLVLRIGCIILLWHSLGLPYNYFTPVIINKWKLQVSIATTVLIGLEQTYTRGPMVL